MKYYLIIMIVLLSSCFANAQDVGELSANSDDYDIKINFDRVVPNEKADTMRVNFKMLKDGNKVSRFGHYDLKDVTIKEIGYNGNYLRLVDVVGLNNRSVNENLSIVVLVDKSASISESEFSREFDAIKKFYGELPNVSLYLAAMDSCVTETKFIRNDGDIDTWFRSDDVYIDFGKLGNRTEKYLYKAIISKLEEMSGVPNTCYPDMNPNQQLVNDTTSNMMLFVLTNGKVTDDNGMFIGGADFFRYKNHLMYEIPRMIEYGTMKNIPIYCIYFGSENVDESQKNEMRVICHHSADNNHERGHFYESYMIDSLRNTLVGTIEDFRYDSQLVLVNMPGKVFNGQSLEMRVWIQNTYNKAFGSVKYSMGTPAKPIKVVKGNYSWNNALLGLLIGCVFSALVYLFMQYLLPLILYKLFLKRYVMLYSKFCNTRQKGEDVVMQKCYYCKDEFQNDDVVVAKCKHTVHWDCWVENRNRCPEYGMNKCKEGAYYYNQKQLSDERNSPYFTRWMIFGLISGMLSWVFYQIIPQGWILPGAIESIVMAMNPLGDSINQGAALNLVGKIQYLLLCGTVFGFFVTLMFSYIIDYHKKNIKNVGVMFARAIFNAMVGFVSFFLGSLIIIAFGKDTSCFWTDWIPWLFFGSGITWMISYKTEVDFKNALIGGLIAVLFSFINLFVFDFVMVGMFSFMIYGAGLGTAIAVVHHVSERYFLHVEGTMKPRDIAIYKWMNVSGGFNRVSIGRSEDCVIEMNWDNSANIAQKQVELYLENDRPYCRAITDGTIMGGDNWPLRKDEVIMLKHGTSFTIGATKFTYIEKDR